jgi:hypothetical protein
MYSERKLLCRLISLNCIITDEKGFDDVFLKVDGKKVWPKKKKQKSVPPGITFLDVELHGIEPDSNIEVEIWDYDFISANDLLGSMKLFIDEPGGPFNTDMIPNVKETKRARYSIDWEIDFDY